MDVQQQKWRQALKPAAMAKMRLGLKGYYAS
jgi:hypothetical protein